MSERVYWRDFDSDAKMPRTIVAESHGDKYHESCMRAWHIMRRTKMMLADGVPQAYVLAYIEWCEMQPEPTDGPSEPSG